MIDTGIATSHGDFGGRAANVYDAFGGNGQDCNGHGTHVAGTIGGATWGVAKGVSLRGVRVLNCSGSGSTSGIISAINWVRTNAVRPAVANMSLGGGFSSALNQATTNLANSGVFMAVAAGNENQNACNVSPASAPGTFTSAASDRNDVRASFSNWGGCVDGYAPGVGDHVRVAQRRHQHDQRHVDGEPAHRGRRRRSTRPTSATRRPRRS